MPSLRGLFGLGIATTSERLQTFGILSWQRQEERNLRSQDLMMGPAWSISSGNIRSGPGALPGFSFWRASANSVGENSPVKEEPLGVGIFQSSEVSSLTSLVVSRSLVSYFPFCISCEAMAFAEIGHWRVGCLERPVSLLIMVHALRLEWVKSMDWTASFRLLCLSSSSFCKKAEAVLLDSGPLEADV